MIKKSIFAFLALIGLMVAPFTTGHAVEAIRPQAVATQKVDRTKPVFFAHELSDLLPDPNVRFGRLDNGMGYVIMKNATPPNTASIRLRIAAGSLMEKDHQQGLAHFLEHMAFNGSKNVPEGEMIKLLERHGLKFGPDTNAYTSFDETVYMLDLPKTTKEIISDSLFLMRETAGNLTLDAGAIERERGVILSEERARQSPGMNNYMAFAKNLVGNQAYANRLPIGKTEIIKTAPRQAFVDFYQTYYRPERATLIVVGDIDPDQIEALIKEKFSSWQSASKTALAKEDFGSYTPKGMRAKINIEQGLMRSISLVWAKPYSDDYQNLSKVEKEFRDELLTDILNKRIAKKARETDSAFVGGSFGQGALDLTIDTLNLSITPKAGQEKAALSQVMAIFKQFTDHGILESELEREHQAWETSYKTRIESQNTRQTPNLASSLVSSLSNLSVFSTPEQDYEIYKKLKNTLSLSAINKDISSLFNAADGPLIWLTADQKIDLTETELEKTYAELIATKTTPFVDDVVKAWPYESFGAAQKPIKREEIKDLGIVRLTYGNGVRVSLKTTDFTKDKILIQAATPFGMRHIPATEAYPLLLAKTSPLFDGGLGKLNADALRLTLSGKTVTLSHQIGDDQTRLSGSTSRKDFALQAQLISAFLTDAARDQAPIVRTKIATQDALKQIDATPSGVFAKSVLKAFNKNDARYGYPSADELKDVNNDAVSNVLKTALSSGPLEVTIVGDISEAEVTDALSTNLATLPQRAKLKAPFVATQFSPPSKEMVFHHKGRADQSLSLIVFKGPDFWSNPKRARAIQVLNSVLDLRLTKIVREEKAISYSPFASISQSLSYKDYGYILIGAEIEPKNHDPFVKAVDEIITDLQTTPISADELLRARKPLVDRIDSTQKNNGYWLQALSNSWAEPRVLDTIRTRKSQLLDVTAKDIQNLAKTWLTSKDRYSVKIVKSEEPK